MNLVDHRTVEFRFVNFGPAFIKRFLCLSISIFLLFIASLSFAQSDLELKQKKSICAKYFDRLENYLTIEIPSLETSLKHNKVVLEILNQLPISQSKTKKPYLTNEDAKALFHKVDNHPVVGRCALPKYDPSRTHGFCYGRSEAFARAARDMNVNDDSIKKVFAIGHFFKPGVTTMRGWQYHVITLVRAEDKTWFAFDPILNEGPVSVESWYQEMRSISLYRAMNLFVTDSQRVYPDNSERIFQSPLLSPEANQYFKDYFDSLQSE